jgi:hypothetical protein
VFNCFINDLHSIFDGTCDPVCLDETSINSLSFADDLVILSESQSGLQSALNKLENYCHKWQLTVNKNKTKVMIFHTGNTFQSQFFLSKIKTY